MWTELRQTRLAPSVGVIFAALLRTSTVAATPPFALNMQEVGVESVNLVNVVCTSIWNNATGTFEPGRARCTNTAVQIRKPSVHDIELEVAEIERYSRSDKFTSEFPKKCEEFALMERTAGETGYTFPEPMRAFLREANQACRAKDRAAFIAALKTSKRSIDAFTCKVEQSPAREVVFEMKNEHLWQAVRSTTDGAAVATLWRADAKSAWNLKQVTSASPNCQEPLCEKDSIVEWRSDAELKLQDCRYFER